MQIKPIVGKLQIGMSITPDWMAQDPSWKRFSFWWMKLKVPPTNGNAIRSGDIAGILFSFSFWFPISRVTIILPWRDKLN